MNEKMLAEAEAAEAAMMMRSAAVHCDPNAPASVEQQPLPDGLKKKKQSEKSPAEWAYERIILFIQNFEKQMDNEHEVAMGFTGGDVGVLRIEGMGFFAPDILTFYGSDESGSNTQLVQHVSQLNVMLRALPKVKERTEARRIGFRMAEEMQKA